MSGKLKLLPKKTFTPWNAQNIERVIRDERIAAEKQQKQQNDAYRAENLERIQRMKMAAAVGNVDNVDDGFINKSLHTYDGTTNVMNSQGTQQGHVNLFEIEEQKIIQSVLLGTDAEGKPKKSVGIMPVYLNGQPCSKNCNQSDNEIEFYVRKDYLTKDVDDKLKMKMDPMREFLLGDAKKSINTVDTKSTELVKFQGCPDIDTSNHMKDQNDYNENGECNNDSSPTKRGKRQKSHKHKKSKKDGKRTHKHKKSRDKNDQKVKKRQKCLDEHYQHEKNSKNLGITETSVNIGDLLSRQRRREEEESNRELKLHRENNEKFGCTSFYR